MDRFEQGEPLSREPRTKHHLYLILLCVYPRNQINADCNCGYINFEVIEDRTFIVIYFCNGIQRKPQCRKINIFIRAFYVKCNTY